MFLFFFCVRRQHLVRSDVIRKFHHHHHDDCSLVVPKRVDLTTFFSENCFGCYVGKAELLNTTTICSIQYSPPFGEEEDASNGEQQGCVPVLVRFLDFLGEYLSCPAAERGFCGNRSHFQPTTWSFDASFCRKQTFRK